MHYLITGHTGFKGSWLALILSMQGHTVSGISLEPESKSLYVDAKLSNIFAKDLRVDIRDRVSLRRAVEEIAPNAVIHLAAQPLVRYSYLHPQETFDTNVMGTINLLEATRTLKDLKAVLIVTTDKVYKNFNHLRGYVETDELGGVDPYSASKAAADIAAQSWIASFAEVPMAIARAGNVIGGGDWAPDRIIPDLVRAYSSNEVPVIRYPEAIRPWQYVLDCLNGYLKLIDAQISDQVSGEWNFGPDLLTKPTVAQLVTKFGKAMGLDNSTWVLENSLSPHEAGNLLLDSTKARSILGWKDRLDFDATINWTADWYKNAMNLDVRSVTEGQVSRFLSIAD
jgi:CDP-glucose 4,6-dehydratase